MLTINELPLYLKAKDVAKILPLGKTKIYELMNDPNSGVITVPPANKLKLWPREKFIAYLENFDNQSA